MAQIHGKQLRNTSVGLAKINNAGSQGTTLFAAGTMIGVSDAPTLGTDLTNKTYVDSLSSGLDPKESVRLATRIDISGTYAAAGGTGTTGAFTAVDLTSDVLFDLTGGATTIIIGDRILIKDQTDAKQNGIYVVTTAGAAGVIERSTDQDGSPASEVSGGNFTFVETGDTFNDKGYVLQGDGLLTLNTDNLNWVQFSSVASLAGGNGIDITSSIVTVDLATTSGLTFNTGKLLVDAGNGITLGITGVEVSPDSTTGATVAPLSVSVNGAGVTVDNSTIVHTTGTIRVASAGITATQLNTSVAGNGLTGGGGTALSVVGDFTTGGFIMGVTVGLNGVGVDLTDIAFVEQVEDIIGSTLTNTATINFTYTDAAGTIEAIVNANSISESHLTTSVAGNGLTGGNGTALSVVADGTTGGVIIPVSVTGNGVGVNVTNVVLIEAMQDAVGSILTDSATIDFTYDDALNTITAIVFANSISESHLTTSVAGTGISGGNGTALSVDYSILGAAGAAIEASALASVANGQGASMVGIEDAAGNFTATDVEAALIELYTLILNSGVPVIDNKNMTASVTTADGDAATATTIVGTPSGDSYVQVYVNGVKVVVGNGVKTDDCYFSVDGGTTARSISAVTALDTLYWNGTISGYELDAADKVDFDYVV